jgi:hypothetical protein
MLALSTCLAPELGMSSPDVGPYGPWNSSPTPGLANSQSVSNLPESVTFMCVQANPSMATPQYLLYQALTGLLYYLLP